MVIQVKHTPRNTVYIHELSSYPDVDDMLSNITMGLPPGRINETLKWVDGIVLTFVSVPGNTEFTTMERSKGILRWDHVSFAPMENYQENFNLPNGVMVNVMNVSHNETFCAIGKFLKKHIGKK